MDSGNSGSLQSSSGGDDEYAAADDSISAFLHHHMPPAPPSSSHQPSSTLFDPLSNYFDVFSRSTPPPISHPMGVWSSRAFTSHPISTTAPSTHMLPASHLSSTQHAAGASFSFPQGGLDTSPPILTLTDQTTAPRRPSKKRSRASRRAPTTVLTTDTTNFRAMVQEFTGIPAPPFSASPFPPTTRLDLFNNTLRSSAHLEPPTRPPPYLLRPFPHKLHPPPSYLTSSTSSTSNYRLLSELGISKANMQNPVLTFAHSLQQSMVPPNSSGFVQTSQHPISHATSSQEEFNLQQTTTDQLNSFVNVIHEDDSGCKMINYCHTGGSSSSPKHNEKGSDQNVISKTTTGEGIVDSWICSSD